MQRLPCLFALHCVSVHDDEGHDEETEIHKYDDHHWYNERPHKVCVRVQPASSEQQCIVTGTMIACSLLCILTLAQCPVCQWSDWLFECNGSYFECTHNHIPTLEEWPNQWERRGPGTEEEHLCLINMHAVPKCLVFMSIP